MGNQRCTNGPHTDGLWRDRDLSVTGMTGRHPPREIGPMAGVMRAVRHYTAERNGIADMHAMRLSPIMQAEKAQDLLSAEADMFGILRPLLGKSEQP